MAEQDKSLVLDSHWPAEPAAERQREFRRLADEWILATGGMPRILDKIRHPAYQQIVNWGWDAVPYILAEIQRGDTNHWYEALHEITRADPVPPEHRGNLKQMGEAWVKWGRNQHLI